MRGADLRDVAESDSAQNRRLRHHATARSPRHLDLSAVDSLLSIRQTAYAISRTPSVLQDRSPVTPLLRLGVQLDDVGHHSLFKE